MKPFVSILIITYNQIDFISETLRSALEQDYENLEVVVADDGSADGTADVILEFSEKYPERLIPLVGGPNLGITGNSNRALKACRGEYIAFQGGDDLFLPGKISAQVEFMENHPEYALSYHNIDVFDSASGNSLWLWFDRYKKRVGDAGAIIKYGTFMGATSVVMRRSMCPDLYFDERIKISSDWLFWIEALARSGNKIGVIDKVYAKYRRHDSNVTLNNCHKFLDMMDTLYIVRNKYPQLLSQCEDRCAVVCLLEIKRLFFSKKMSDIKLILPFLFKCSPGLFFALNVAFRRLLRLKI